MALRFLALGTLGVLATLPASSAVAPLPLDGVSFEIPAPSFPSTAGSGGAMAGERLLNFDLSGATDTPALSVSVPPIAPGHSVTVLVEWDQAAGASSGVDLCVSGATGSTTVTDFDGRAAGCTGLSAAGEDSAQTLIIGNPADAAGSTARQTLKVMVGVASNALATTAPGRMTVSVRDEGLGVSATAAAAAPAAPALVLGASTIDADTTTTITWTSVNASYCTTTGSTNAYQTGWEKDSTVATSGTYSVTPINTGSYTYSLYCTNSAGHSPVTSVTLTVKPSPFSGGVGALDPWSLLALAGCVALFRKRAALPTLRC
jgi:hypothetical protein